MRTWDPSLHQPVASGGDFFCGAFKEQLGYCRLGPQRLLLRGVVQFSVSPLVVSAPVSGSVVLMTPDMRFLELDPTGGEIWELIAAGATVDEVVCELCERYKIDVDTATADTETFIGYLAELGVVSITD